MAARVHAVTDGSSDVGAQYRITLASYLALVYHEARNVRFLISDGHIDSRPWECLRALPRDRDDAWIAIQPVRQMANAASTAAKAAQVFATRFAADLDAVVALYDHPAWKNARIGGNQWAHVSRAVRDLRDALNSDRIEDAALLLASLPTMRHNTGTVGEKLAHLERLMGPSADGTG